MHIPEVGIPESEGVEGIPGLTEVTGLSDNLKPIAGTNLMLCGELDPSELGTVLQVPSFMQLPVDLE